MGNINERIVLIGGGGGVYRVARYLKHSRQNIVTIQTTFDAGGHSRKLKDERGMLPPGDIRQAILALSDDSGEQMLRQLLGFRFPSRGDSTLNGATMGNLLLTALTEITGSLPAAIKVMSDWYGVKGKVLPVSLDHATLCVKFSDGSTMEGEGNIDTRPIEDERRIVEGYLKPEAHLYGEAGKEIREADKIIFCPGDLYTSIIPNTLVTGFKEALAESRGQVIYVVNIMTKKAETDGFTASKFASELLRYTGRKCFDTVICNSTPIPPALVEKYLKEKASPVEIDAALSNYATKIVAEPLADTASGIVRHHESIARIIASL